MHQDLASRILRRRNPIPADRATRFVRRVTRTTAYVSQFVSFWYHLHDKNLLERFDHGVATNELTENAPTKETEKVLQRVVVAYERAKRHQAEAPPEYAAGPMWEGIIERNFSELLSAARNADRSSFGHLLGSFHRQRFAMGAGGSYDDYLAFRRNPLYRYQFCNTWVRYVRAYESVGGTEEDLVFSQVGQPVGMETRRGVVPLEAIRYHYWARRFRSLLEGGQRHVIGEIGGGLGGQAFKVVERKPGQLCYMVFDIPETLLVASYFLLRSLPEHRILLYGEDTFGADAMDRYDVILMPSFAIPALPDFSVDLWFNACSFSEMLRSTAEEYLHHIERTCRGHFLHVNHTVQFRWTVGERAFENLPADELLPDPERFGLLEAQPRPFGRVEDREFLRRHGAEHNVYLYTRRP